MSFTESLCFTEAGSANSKNGLLGLIGFIAFVAAASVWKGFRQSHFFCLIGSDLKLRNRSPWWALKFRGGGQNAAAPSQDRRACVSRRGQMTHAGLATMAVAASLGPA